MKKNIKSNDQLEKFSNFVIFQTETWEWKSGMSGFPTNHRTLSYRMQNTVRFISSIIYYDQKNI